MRSQGPHGSGGLIAPLRRRHRWLAPASFAAALVGVLAGVMVRPDAFVEAGSGRDSVLAAPQQAEQAARLVPGTNGLSAALVPGEGDRLDLWLMAGARLEAAELPRVLTERSAVELTAAVHA